MDRIKGVCKQPGGQNFLDWCNPCSDSWDCPGYYQSCQQGCCWDGPSPRVPQDCVGRSCESGGRIRRMARRLAVGGPAQKAPPSVARLSDKHGRSGGCSGSCHTGCGPGCSCRGNMCTRSFGRRAGGRGQTGRGGGGSGGHRKGGRIRRNLRRR